MADDPTVAAVRRIASSPTTSDEDRRRALQWLDAQGHEVDITVQPADPTLVGGPDRFQPRPGADVSTAPPPLPSGLGQGVPGEEFVGPPAPLLRVATHEQPDIAPPADYGDVGPPSPRVEVQTRWMGDLAPTPDQALLEEHIVMQKKKGARRVDPRAKASQENLFRRQAEMEAQNAQFRDRDESIRNLSKRKSMYMPPMVGDVEQAEVNLEGHPQIYFHPEPSLESTVGWVEARPESKRRTEMLKDLEDKGRDSIYYHHYADAMWKTVHNAFAQSGEPAVRVGQLDYANAEQIINKLVGQGREAVGAAVGGLDQALLFGMGRQALRGSPDAAENAFQGYKRLLDAGILPDASGRMKNAMENHPYLSFPAEMLGFVKGAGLGGRLAHAPQDIAKAAGLEAEGRVAAEMVMGGAAGGIEGALRSGVESVGDIIESERAGVMGPSPEKAMGRMAQTAQTHAMLGAGGGRSEKC